MEETTQNTEKTAQTESQESTTSSNQTTQFPFLNPDGTFRENWQEQLVPKEFQGRGVYAKIGSVKDAMRQLGYLDALVGKKGVIVPSEGASETEWKEFYKAVGVPETPDKYPYEPPQDVELVDLSKEAMKPYIEKLHQAGLTPKQFKETVGLFTNFIKELENEVKTQQEEVVRQAEEKIKEFTGTAYEKRVHLANLAIEKLTADWNPERKKALFDPETGLVNDPTHAELKPYLLDFLAEIGTKLSEHKIIPSVEGGGMTPDQIRAKIAEIEAIPGFILPDNQGNFMSNDGRKDQYFALAKQRDELYKMLYKKQ
ncbi:MAG TPA: hypothetical protein PLV55_06070 [Anaerohalosphaeraceae bacterium]|nr:hypothetical protein [Anaerohalosphaeraceae bacterium]